MASMSIAWTLICGLVAWGLLEACLWYCIKTLRARFPWLITPEDRSPAIPPDAVEKYLERSFDPQTGWRRKAGQDGRDETDNGVASFTIAPGGWRFNPHCSAPPTSILAAGDSFTFCRLVNDDETWPFFLSQQRGTHVANFGVGNYGFDQALLLLAEELPKHRPNTVIIGVVPETIARCRSRWKHYFEYGNMLAFKPSFKLAAGGLELVSSPVNCRDDFSLTHQAIKDLEVSDYFFARKFKRDIIRFPYSLTILRRPLRNLPILWHLLSSHFRGPTARQRGWKKAFDVIIGENSKWVGKLYRDRESTRLLAALIKRLKALCAESGCHPVVMVVPQPSDLRNSDGIAAYQKFFQDMASHVQIVDLTDAFRRDSDPAALYVGGRLGPHCSARGNQLIAQALHQAIPDIRTPDTEGSNQTQKRL